MDLAQPVTVKSRRMKIQNVIKGSISLCTAGKERAWLETGSCSCASGQLASLSKIHEILTTSDGQHRNDINWNNETEIYRGR